MYVNIFLLKIENICIIKVFYIQSLPLAILLLLMMFFLKSHIPDEVLESILVPGTDSIDFHHIKSYSTETPEQHPELDVTQLPLFTHLEHADTNFVYVSIISLIVFLLK